MMIPPKLPWCVWLWIPRKAAPMDHGHLRLVADQCQGVFAASLLNACGTDVRFGRRARGLTPVRGGLARTATGASQRAETIAACHGGFQALCGTSIPAQACYHHVAPSRFAAGARTLTARLIGAMPLTGRGCAKGRAVAAWRPLVRQDGSALASHDGLRAVLPGRVTAGQPAAVALPPTLARRGEAPPTGVLTPDTTRAPTLWPAPAARRARGLLADRGYRAGPSLRRGQAAGGFFRSRAKAGRPPHVVEAWRADGTRWRSLRNQPRTVTHTTRPQRPRVARGEAWPVARPPRRRRLRRRWHRRPQSVCSWWTHLPAPRERRALLDSIAAVIRFATTMTWQGKGPVVALVTTHYQTGVKLTKDAMQTVETQLQRLPGLEKWFVDIVPTLATSRAP